MVTFAAVVIAGKAPSSEGAAEAEPCSGSNEGMHLQAQDQRRTE